LDLGAGFHVVAGDGAAEGSDEGLGIDGVVAVGLAGGPCERGGQVGEDLGFEIEAGFEGIRCASLGVGMGLSGAGGVEVRIEGDEAEELLDVGGDVGADEVLVLRESDGDGRKGKVISLVGELGLTVCGTLVKLVADEGLLGLGGGDVAEIDAVVEGVGLAVGATAAERVVELVVPDEGDVIGRDAGVGFELGSEVVETALEGEYFRGGGRDLRGGRRRRRC
jgi:hypothetical protein